MRTAYVTANDLPSLISLIIFVFMFKMIQIIHYRLLFVYFLKSFFQTLDYCDRPRGTIFSIIDNS